MEDLSKLTVPALKDLCRAKGLKVGGKKSELIERLNLKQFQHREVCCYSISCKEKHNIDLVLDWLTKHAKS